MTAPPPPGSVGGAVGGLHVTTESATQVAAVYGCVSLLADSVASLPLRALSKPATVNTAKELALPPLLKRPYELLSLTDWIVCAIWSLALRGNFIGHITERDSLGYPAQIAPIPPDVVNVRPLTDGTFEWRFAGHLVNKDDVFHIRYQSMPGMILGINPIQMMRYSFGLAHATDVWASEYYGNAANPQGVIESPDPYDETEVKAWAAGWQAAHGGVKKSNYPAILTGGAKFNPIDVSPADQQLLETRKFSQEEISGIVFRIPPHMLGLNERSTSFGRGIEQQERGFVSNTLAGYLCRLERALTECLPGQYANFDIRHRIRGDSLQRAEVSYKMILAGAWTANDAREIFDMPPLPNGEGDVIHSPTNSELLEQQLEELKKSEEEKPEPEQVVVPASNGHGPPQNVPVPK